MYRRRCYTVTDVCFSFPFLPVPFPSHFFLHICLFTVSFFPFVLSQARKVHLHNGYENKRPVERRLGNELLSDTTKNQQHTHTHRKSWGKNNVALHLTLFFSVHKFAFTTLSFLTYPSLQPLFGLRDNRIFPRMPLFTFSSLPFEREKKNCTHISFAISWCLVESYAH